MLASDIPDLVALPSTEVACLLLFLCLLPRVAAMPDAIAFPCPGYMPVNVPGGTMALLS